MFFLVKKKPPFDFLAFIIFNRFFCAPLNGARLDDRSSTPWWTSSLSWPFWWNGSSATRLNQLAAKHQKKNVRNSWSELSELQYVVYICWCMLYRVYIDYICLETHWKTDMSCQMRKPLRTTGCFLAGTILRSINMFGPMLYWFQLGVCEQLDFLWATWSPTKPTQAGDMRSTKSREIGIIYPQFQSTNSLDLSMRTSRSLSADIVYILKVPSETARRNPRDLTFVLEGGVPPTW